MYPLKANKLNITSKYGYREYVYQGNLIKGIHRGIDLQTNPKNDNADVISFDDGEVVAVQNIGKQYENPCYIRIKHLNGYYTLYYHLKSNSAVVKVGDKVKKGEKIAIIGATGKATGIHLHFQIDEGDDSTSIDPYDYVFKDKKLDNMGLILGKRGYIRYGDNSIFISKIANFMYKTFPKYTSIKALGSFYGKYLKSAIKEFQKRAKSEGYYDSSVDGNIGPKTLKALVKYGFKY